MVENIIQMKYRIAINVRVSVGKILYMKKIIFGILLPIVAKMINI